MRKTDYDSIYKEIYKVDTNIKDNIVSYDELKSFLYDIRNKKTKTNNSYSKEKEIAELYALSTGFLSCAIHFSQEFIEEKYKSDSSVYFSLLTNISNDVLGIVNLIDNGFEFQANILVRNLMELIYTFLTLLINKEKRKEYFKSADLNNSYAVWQKNLKMSKLNEELSNFEKISWMKSYKKK